MNTIASIQDTVLTPFTRSIYQKAFLVIGLCILLGAFFYDAKTVSLMITGIATVYVIISFAFKPKLRQHIYKQDDSLHVVKSALMSRFDKRVLCCFILIAVVSDFYALADITMLMLGNVGYQICLSVLVYRLLYRQEEVILPLMEKYLLLENKQSNCLLMKRFDIYLVIHSVEVLELPAVYQADQNEVKERELEFVGTISLEKKPFEGDDAVTIIAELNQYLSTTTGHTMVKKSWRDGVKIFVLSLVGLYAYIFWLPSLFKFMFPVGRYQNKFGDIVTRTEGMSDFSVYFMMFIIFIMLALPCFSAIYNFYHDVRFSTFKAVCATSEGLWLLTPCTSGHYSRKISRSEIAYICYADIKVNEDDFLPPTRYIDQDIKLIGVDGNLISLNDCVWSCHFILDHLVKLGLPVRLVKDTYDLRYG
ncbi:hypothetical protein [Vibrio pectenicida]|uniref:Uncharacterized protein n=1 Tax=Vibrio pectenicida TaxID=62763 RepID=A0A3R9EBF0_9VIBR|nr:hypothetical protein [Vibrio pectenicida]RSD30218.1 hypothetical protein EJA03_15025 [Vibrio pectenicida]